MRVLIVKVSSLGDIIHTLPAVTDAANAKRDLRFDWVVEENFVDIPSWHPAVDRVIPVAIRRWGIVNTLLRKPEVRSFIHELQSVHYDLVIDAQGLIKSGYISRLAKGLTVGLSESTIREPLATLFYNQVYSVPRTIHAVHRIRELFSRTLNYTVNESIIDYGIDVTRVGISKKKNDTPSVLFLHGTTWETKHWPNQYWRQLALIATKEGYEVNLPWGNEVERQRAKYISDGIEGALVLEKQTLSGMACVVSQSDGVIAVDTGLGHLAAALEIPIVSVYGPTDPGLSGTFGKSHLHMKSDFDCAPCVKKKCKYTGPPVTEEFEQQNFLVDPPCHSANNPEKVWQQFKNLLSTKQIITTSS